MKKILTILVLTFTMSVNAVPPLPDGLPRPTEEDLNYVWFYSAAITRYTLSNYPIYCIISQTIRYGRFSPFYDVIIIGYDYYDPTKTLSNTIGWEDFLRNYTRTEQDATTLTPYKP